jgi:hypothetical protein
MSFIQVRSERGVTAPSSCRNGVRAVRAAGDVDREGDE